MEVAPDKLIEIFKAGFRVGEAKRMKTQNPDVVASNEEIESDAYFIVLNVLNLNIFFPRKGNRLEQLKAFWNNLGSAKLSYGQPTRGEQNAQFRREFDKIIPLLETSREQDKKRNSDLYKGVL